MKEIFPNQEWNERFNYIHDFIERNKKQFGLDEKTCSFKSWTDADYWLYGLLYWVLFKGKQISNDSKLFENIQNEISIKHDPKQSPSYIKAPNRLGNLRERMERSIKYYEKYATR